MKLTPTQFELRNCLRELIDPLLPLAQEKNISLQFQIATNIPQYLFGDETALKQILNHLLSNTLKLTATGQIKLNVAAEERLPEHIKLQFNIKSSGLAPSEEQKERILAPFIQATNSMNPRFKGVSLEHSASNQRSGLVEGSIAVNSETGQGSTISITLWMGSTDKKERPPSAQQSQSEALAAAQSKNILIVEDNEINLKLAEYILTKAGYKVDFAPNGKLALEKIRQKQYDLILMDIHMPELDGFQTTALIRKNEQANRTPIIALTADAVQGYRERCIEAGMDSYLPKPYQKESLLQEITTLLGKAKIKEASAPLTINAPLDWLNMEHILQHCQSDPALLTQIAPLFTKRSNSLLSQIESSLRRKKLASVKEQTHALKGTLSNFTTGNPFQLTQQIEKYAECGDAESIIPLLTKLKEEIEGLQSLLTRHFP